MTEEQKAEEYAHEHYIRQHGSIKYRKSVEDVWLDGYHEGFKDCAKARLNVTTISDCPIKDEWQYTHRNKEHQVIDCPKGEETKLYLLSLHSRDSREFEFGSKVPVVCYWNEEWCRFERLEHTIGERVVNPNAICAWKEITPPKEIE